MLKKVVIIGAGPCGLLLAHYLLRRQQYQVGIYESRPEKNLDTLNGKSYLFFIPTRKRKKSLKGNP